MVVKRCILSVQTTDHVTILLAKLSNANKVNVHAAEGPEVDCDFGGWGPFILVQGIKTKLHPHSLALV